MKPSRTQKRRGAIALLGAVCALLAPSAALASSAGVTDGVLTYEAAGGEVNQVTLGHYNGDYTINDGGAIISAGPGCRTTQGGHEAVCSGVTAIVVKLGDQPDSAVSQLLLTRVTIDGGDGGDTLTGGLPSDTLLGGAGDDTLRGGWGGDTIDAGNGTDTVDAGVGSDKIFVRDGAVDTVTCGSETDSGERDVDEIVAADCESLAVPGVEAPADVPTSDGTTTVAEDDPAIDPFAALMPVVLPQTPRANLRGTIPVRVLCPQTATAGCSGLVRVELDDGADEVAAARRRKASRAGRRRFKLAAGQKKAVPVRLDRRSARRLRKRRKIRAKITVQIEVEGGQKLTSERVVTVRERRTAHRRIVRRGGGKGRKRRGRR